MSDTDLVINLREFKEHPEKLTEFLKSFDVETVFMAFKEFAKDYTYADMNNRSIFYIFETDNVLMGVMGGRKSNIVNTLVTEAKDHPEILDVVSTVQKLADSEKIVINPNTKHIS